MTGQPSDLYIFVVDTDQYAGNFERELVAYATATVGECGVGSELAAEALTDLEFSAPDVLEWLDANVHSEHDYHGCARPASIWQSRTGGYNSVALFLGEEPPAAVLAVLKERALGYCLNRVSRRSLQPEPIEVLGFRLIKRTTTFEELGLQGAQGKPKPLTPVVDQHGDVAFWSDKDGEVLAYDFGYGHCSRNQFDSDADWSANGWCLCQGGELHDGYSTLRDVLLALGPEVYLSLEDYRASRTTTLESVIDAARAWAKLPPLAETPASEIDAPDDDCE